VISAGVHGAGPAVCVGVRPGDDVLVGGRDGAGSGRGGAADVHVGEGDVGGDAALFESYREAIVAAFDEADYVELAPRALIVHGKRNDETSH
jgi:hypothetical protein